MSTPPLKADFTFTGRIEQAAAAAARAEAHGADGVLVNEMKHDAFLQLALAAGATRRADLVSAVAIAFARNPMTVATAAYDVQRLSGGRLTVGLGSQVKPHITHRYRVHLQCTGLQSGGAANLKTALTSAVGRDTHCWP
ncbi:LLM class flavin-dependent oxidoreductase [Streptomyces sp. NPDC001070]